MRELHRWCAGQVERMAKVLKWKSCMSDDGRLGSADVGLSCGHVDGCWGRLREGKETLWRIRDTILCLTETPTNWAFRNTKDMFNFN